MAKFLGPTGLTVLWSRIKAWVKRYAYITSSTSGGITTNTITIDSKSVIVPSKTSELNNDAGFITGADIPEGAAASSATPLMDGTASAGTSNAFARGDHRHPTDTTRQATITGGASTITSTNLTVSRALISNTSGKVAVSDVTSTELDYLDGVTSNVLTQLDNKANKPSGTVTAGHVATLDANGNLVDSGVSTSDIGTDTKNTTGSTNDTSKMYVVGAKTQAANPQTYSRASVYIGADGKLRSGFGINSATDADSTVATASDLSGKADKVSGATLDNIAVFDSNGNLKDSGKNSSKLLTKVNGINALNDAVSTYVVCNSNSDSRSKFISMPVGYVNSLDVGAQLIVNFENPNTATTPYIEFDDITLDKKEIVYRGERLVSPSEASVLKGIVNLVYNGTYWEIVSDPFSINSYTGGTVYAEYGIQFGNSSNYVTYRVDPTQDQENNPDLQLVLEGQSGVITTNTLYPEGSPGIVIGENLITGNGAIVASPYSLRSNTKVWNTNGSITDLSNYATTSNIGQANGIASLDATGKVPSSQLPSYVDDVVEAYIRSGQTALSSTWLATGSASGTAITPEAGVIYIIMNGNSTYPTNSEYRWSGSTYVQLYDGGCTEMTESEMNIAVMGSDTSTWT